MIEREIIGVRLGRMRESANRLAQIGRLSLEEYPAGSDHQALAEYHLRIAIEAAIDIANHIVAACGFRKPLSLRDCITILAEHQVLPVEFARRIAGMVGLRNRLVHLYTEIDHARIYEILRNELGDFEVFAQRIVAYIEAHQGAEASSNPPSP